MSSQQNSTNSCEEQALSCRTGGRTGDSLERVACQLHVLPDTHPADVTARHTNLDVFTPYVPTASWLVHDDSIAVRALAPTGTEV